VNKSLDAALTEFARRRLSEPYPYLILDTRYERIREGGVITSQAVLVAVAVDGEGAVPGGNAIEFWPTPRP
jgi:transposase-like protein